MKNSISILTLFAFALIFASCGGDSANGADAPAAVTQAKEGEEIMETKKVTNVMADLYQLDPNNSVLNWKGTKKIGGGHAGTMKLSAGRLAYIDHRIAAGEITVDVTSMATTDDMGDKAASLNGHLKNEDFLDVGKYPTAKFVFQKIQPIEDPKDGFNYSVSGPLTLRGVTKVVSIPANVEVLDKKIHVTSPKFNINRTEFGIKYGSGLFGAVGDKVINDNVEMSFDVMFNYQS